MVVYGENSNHRTPCSLAEQRKKRAGHRQAISDRAGNAYFNFRTSSGSAPQIQFAADLRGTLTHSRQTIVVGTAFFQDLGRNTLPVIPNAQPEGPFSVSDLGFN